MSMLQGGTAPITPQAGGGSGAPPPGHDPSVSLLNSGGGPQITPQAGGATDEEAQAQAIGLVDAIVSSDFADVDIPDDRLQNAIDYAKRQIIANVQSDITDTIKKILSGEEQPSGAALAAAGTGATAASLPSFGGPGYGSSLSPSATGPGLRATATPAPGGPLLQSAASPVPFGQAPAVSAATEKPPTAGRVRAAQQQAARRRRGQTQSPPPIQPGKGSTSAFAPTPRAATPTGPGATAAAAAATAASLVPTGAEADALISSPELTDDQRQQIDTAMKEAFTQHYEGRGRDDLLKGRKTLEEVSKDCAAASVAAGAILAKSFLGQKAALVKKPLGEATGEGASETAAAPEFHPLDRIVNQSAEADPFYLEYYKVLAPTSGQEGLESWIDYTRRNYSTKAWKTELLNQMDRYEARRKALLWTPTPIRGASGATAARAPIFPRPLPPGSSLSQPQILTQFDRVALRLTQDAQAGLTLIAAPPVRGDAKAFLNILHSLERLTVLEVVLDEKTRKPKLALKKSVVLAFMPPFYAQPIDIPNNKNNAAENTILLSLFLSLEESNPNKVFALSESTTDNYTVGVTFHEYRGERQKSDSALVNLLEPSYIYFAEKHKGTGGVLLSASTDAETDLPTDEPLATLKLFKPKPTANSAPIGNFIRVRSIDMVGKQAFVIPQPFETSGEACVSSGLLKRIETDDLVKDKNPPPIYLKKVLIEDAIGTKREDEILLVFRLVYDTSRANKPVCDYSTSAVIQPPRPTDQFYASKRAQTKGTFYTQVNFFESSSKADTSPTYYIRRPTAGTRVYSDWVQQIFTQDEANFLNAVGFTPEILAEVFKGRQETWQLELANYLEGIAITRCFTDNRFMLMGECRRNRIFMDLIREYFAEKRLSVETLQEERDRKMQAEVKRYLDEIDASKRAEGMDAFPSSGEENMTEIASADFIKNKPVMDTLYVYYEIPKTGEATACANIIVVTKQGKHKFFKICVAQRDYERNPFIFYETINAKKKKYPTLSFIY